MVMAGMHDNGDESESTRQELAVKLIFFLWHITRIHNKLFLIMQPSKIVVHPKYSRLSRNKDHDLALLLFKKPGFNTTLDAVTPICVWEDDYNFDSISHEHGKVIFIVQKMNWSNYIGSASNFKLNTYTF